MLGEKKSKVIFFLNFLRSFFVFEFGISNFFKLTFSALDIFILLFINDKNYALKKETVCYKYLEVIREIWITVVFDFMFL